MKNKFWFRKRRGILSKDLGYGWIPISWQGYALIFLVIIINIAGMIYFNFPYTENSIIKFVVTLILSMIIFAIIAKFKTRR